MGKTRRWLLTALGLTAIVSGLGAFRLAGFSWYEATYQTASLFFSPHNEPPDSLSSPTLYNVARFSALAAAVVAVIAAYLAVTGASVRAWSRRQVNRYRRGHTVVLSDHPVPINSSQQRKWWRRPFVRDAAVVRISTSESARAQVTVAGTHLLVSAAEREHVARCATVIVALQHFADSVRTALELRDALHKAAHAPLILVHTPRSHDAEALRSSRINSGVTKGPFIDAYHPGDLYAHALSQFIRTEAVSPRSLEIFAQNEVVKRVIRDLRLWCPDTPVYPAGSHATRAHSVACFVWDSADDFASLLDHSNDSRERWCITSDSNSATAFAMGFRIIRVDTADVYAIRAVSELETLAFLLHSYYLEHSGNPSGLSGWEGLTPAEKNSNRRQAAVLVEAVHTYKRSELTFQEAENLAAAEHESWCREKLDRGWTYHPIRNDRRQHHDALLAWDKLPRQQQSDLINQVQRHWGHVYASLVESHHRTRE